MRIHAIQAFEGDALLLEASSDQPKFALIDAGPAGAYDEHVRKHLGSVVGQGGQLDAVIVSHIDGDHIIGVLDLLADIERAAADGEDRPFDIKDIWHNSFAATIDDAEGSLAAGVRSLLTWAGAANHAMSETATVFLGIREGVRLRRQAAKLGIALNGAFDSELISPDTLIDPNWSLGDATIRIVGPTDANLRELRSEWEDWLERNAEEVAEGNVAAMANTDKSVPNLSSLVMLVSSADGTVLLTGDARGDHILQGLEAAGLLDNGPLEVDVLKVQHHGSDRNIDREFLRRVKAKVYLISANGKHDNPDYATLASIVEVAAGDGGEIVIAVTNQTASVEQLLASHPPEQHNYRLVAREPGSHALVVELAAGDKPQVE